MASPTERTQPPLRPSWIKTNSRSESTIPVTSREEVLDVIFPTAANSMRKVIGAIRMINISLVSFMHDSRVEK